MYGNRCLLSVRYDSSSVKNSIFLFLVYGEMFKTSVWCITLHIGLEGLKWQFSAYIKRPFELRLYKMQNGLS